MDKEKIKNLIETKYKEQYENERMFSIFVDDLLHRENIDEDAILDNAALISRVEKTYHSTVLTIIDVLKANCIEMIE